MRRMSQQAIEPLDVIWMNGALVPWTEARVHVLTHALHYGYGAFEGIRCYRTADGRSAVFRLDAHLRRLFDSARILMIPMGVDAARLHEACLETIRRNRLVETYLRPMVFVGAGALGFGVMDNPTDTIVVAWRWGAYLGAESAQRGIRAKISSFLRHHVDVGMVKAKVIGQYTNAILAKREVTLLGFDEAILLDVDGYVTEASGQNLFIVRDGVVKTPPLSSSILPGITRDSVIRLCRDAGIPVVEERFPRDEMYVADEVFLTGTATEVVAVREIDHRGIGAGGMGEITRMLQERYAAVCRGREPRYADWLTYV
jgi:branched-chain amino acid aminotransferase